MRARLRFVCLVIAWASPATLAIDLTGCNDGSTGCCLICPECACGNSCTSCSTKCTQPKGCACGTVSAGEAPLDNAAALTSVTPDGGAHE